MNPFEFQPREKWLEKCRDLFFFETQVLVTCWLDKFHDFGYLHRKLCDFLTVSKRPSLKKLVAIFRGSFKTTVLLGYCLWLFCWHIARKKPISICYNTATQTNAEAFMEDFREALRECKLLHDIFPEVPYPQEGVYRKFSQKKVEYKWVKFHVASLDTKQVSRHYTVIINDDLVNDDNAFSEKERDAIKRKWKFQKSIITRYKKLKVGLEVDVGSPFHPLDIMSLLIKKIKTYDKFIIPYALTKEGKIPALYKDEEGEWRIAKEGAKLTLPEMFTWEDFEDKIEEQGRSIFGSQYELKVLEEEERLVDEKWIRYWQFLPENYIRHMVIDPAGTEKESNDATGITIVDWDARGTMHIVYAEKCWVTPMKLIGKIASLQKQLKPDDTFIEKEKYSITIADTLDLLAPKMDLSFVEHRNRPKPKRIHKLKQYFESGRVLLGQGMRELESDLTNYPDIDNDDVLDSLAYQLDEMDLPNKKIQRDNEPEIEPGFELEINKLIGLDKETQEDMDAIF